MVSAEKKVISNEPTVQQFMNEMNHKQTLTDFNATVKKYQGVMIIAKKEEPKIFQEAKEKYELLRANHTRSIG